MLAFVQLEHRFARLEVAARQQSRLLELHQHTVDRREPDIGAVLQQGLEHILGGHMPLRGALEDFEDLDARQRGLQAAALEFVGMRHGGPGRRGRVDG